MEVSGLGWTHVPVEGKLGSRGWPTTIENTEAALTRLSEVVSEVEEKS